MENTAISTYPIIIGGQTRGTLNIRVDGLFTWFEGECDDTGDILRLSVYGEVEGYLGVMLPDGGRVKIKKKLSKADMRAFPIIISHAGPAGEGGTTVNEPSTGTQMDPEPAIEVFSPATNLPLAVPDIIDETGIPEPREEETAPSDNKIREDACEMEEPPCEVKEEEHSDRAAEADENTGGDNSHACETTSCGTTEETPGEQDKPLCVPGESVGSEVLYASGSWADIPDRSGAAAVCDSGNRSVYAETDTYWIPEPNPWSLFADSAMKAAWSGAKGTIIATHDQKALLGLPVLAASDLPLIPLGDASEKRSIEGVEYYIFVVNNGNIV